MDSIIADVRGALRSLVRRPATSLVSSLTFGLGIAAAAAMFSVVSAVLLAPLPFAQAEQLMNVFPTIPEFRRDPRLSSDADRASFSWREYQAWSAQQSSFSSVGVIADRSVVVSAGGSPEQLRIVRATPSLFATLRVAPGAGRLLTDADNESEDRGVLVTDAFASARWGAATAALGQEVRLNDVAYAVVGVLPPSFRLDGYEVPVWTALGGPADRIGPSGNAAGG
jgi:putative ABC transport system permease protein